MLSEMNETFKSSKIRDEDVIPTVHAFNILRAAFNDTNLATDTSGFSAEALIITIRSFSSPYWEIRNSACLAYTALVRRMIGFLNVQKQEYAWCALTGLEFFHRYNFFDQNLNFCIFKSFHKKSLCLSKLCHFYSLELLFVSSNNI